MHLINRRTFAVLMLAMFVSPALFAGVQTRIVGGQESLPNARPYFAGLMDRSIQVTVRNNVYSGALMNGSASNVAESILIDCGSGFDPCVGVNGNICLIKRGDTTFREKVINCQAGGGIGAIIYNNVSGSFSGNVALPLFKNIDASNDGRLDAAEFEEVTGIQKTFAELDVNNDSQLTQSEYALLEAEEPQVTIPVASVSAEVGAEIADDTGRVARTGLPNSSFCGGVYIGNGWVMTAGHCVFNDVESFGVESAAQQITVNIGGHDLRTDQDNVIGVSEIRVHENYRIAGDPEEGVPTNDFALLKLLKEPANVQPVKIATAAIVSQAEEGGEYGTAIGRGVREPVLVTTSSNEAPTPPDELVFEVQMPFVSKSVCDTAYPNALDGSMVCAGTGRFGEGTCFGDSGGPILIHRDGNDYVAGITSFGSGCAQAGFYDVYSRVPAFLSQINEALDLPPPDPKDINSGLGAFGLPYLFIILVLSFLRQSTHRLDTKRYD